jgi:hypothetical membrane protein
MNNLKTSGLLFYLSGAIVLLGIITAEAMYPSGYTTFKNEISDLGATRQPNSVSFEPSSSIFNSIMWLSGLMILMATFYQHKYFKKLLFTIPVTLFGLGLLALAFFQGTFDPITA